ncbi:MAG TPA: TIR domain-containing protein [Isosphaeraceae bacterium]|jgi:hypothetical protein
MAALENAHALVIGIADYAQIRKLPRVADAGGIANALADPALCGYPPAGVQLLEDAQATGAAIRSGLAALARDAGPKSTVFLYFSGHGGQIREGPNRGQYLLPVDTVYPTDDDLARTAIPAGEFTAALNAIKAHRLTVVLDCCHAGGLGEPKDLVPAARVEPGLSDGYLNTLKAGTGRVIIAATRSSDPAYVRDGARYGVFTGHFLEGLRGAARGDGGVIRVLDLYTFVQQKVVADQPNQRPVLKVELEDNYPIALHRGGRAPAAAPAPPPADGFAYDVFLSYRQQEPDKTWVRKTLLPRLKAEGLKVFIDYLDFRLGAPIVTEMERAVAQSRYTVGVLSPNYLASNFTDLESILAEHVGLEQSQRRFVGVMREPCKPRLGIRARYYLDMTDPDEFEPALARLVAQLRLSPDIERIET